MPLHRLKVLSSSVLRAVKWPKQQSPGTEQNRDSERRRYVPRLRETCIIHCSSRTHHSSKVSCTHHRHHMIRHSVKALVFVSLAAALTTLGACSDRKEVGADVLEAVEAGVPRDSLFELMGKGPLTANYADTLRVDHGFRLSKYFVNGDFFEVVYFREAPGDVSEPVQQAQETPVVLQNGKVLGWGWRFYVEEGIGKLGLPTPLKEEQPSVVVPPSPNGASDSLTKPGTKG